MYQILIAEDESRISSFIEKGLKSHGFMTVVVSSGAEVLSQVSSSAFDLMLLDLGLPDKDGLKVIEELRGQGINFPIIILTARDEIDDKVAGLEGGRR